MQVYHTLCGLDRYITFESAEIERIIATLESRKIVGASLNVQQIKEILTPSSDHAGKTGEVIACMHINSHLIDVLLCYLCPWNDPF